MSTSIYNLVYKCKTRWIQPALYALMALSSCENKEKISFNNDPEITSDYLFTLVQYRIFQYFWNGYEGNSGLEKERFHLDDPSLDALVVTTGGSGFGLMA